MAHIHTGRPRADKSEGNSGVYLDGTVRAPEHNS